MTEEVLSVDAGVATALGKPVKSTFKRTEQSTWPFYFPFPPLVCVADAQGVGGNSPW